MIRGPKQKVILLLCCFIVSAAYLGFIKHLPARYPSEGFSKEYKDGRLYNSQSDVKVENYTSSSGRKSAAIPKILHYVFETETPYEDYKPLIRRCLQLNTDWSVYLWRDSDSQRLIREHYSHFADKYDGYRDRLERSDSVRYIILHKFGGIYLDMDTECLQSFDKLLQAANTSTVSIERESSSALAFLTEERREQTQILYGYSFCTMNSLMGSTPGHPFFKALIGQMKAMPNMKHARLSTGPDLLTKAYEGWLACAKCLPVKYPVNVFPARLVSPLMDTLVNWKQKCQPYIQVNAGSEPSDYSPEDRWRRQGCADLAAKGWLFDNTDDATVTVHKFLHLGYGNQSGRKKFDLLKELPRVKTYYTN